MIGFARVVLWLAALTFAAVGIAFLLWPLRLAAMVQLPLANPTALVDFYATYGGFQLGFGVVLIMCARRREKTRFGLLAVACGLGGFAVGRIFGLLSVTGSPKPIIYAYLAVEVTGTAVALWAARAENILSVSCRPSSAQRVPTQT